MIIYQMSTNKSNLQLKKYLIFGGVLGATILLFKYFSNKTASKQGCSIDTAKKIMKEVKYQMYTYCIPFVELVNSKIKAGTPIKDIEIYSRTELAKGYEIKENLILSKYDTSKEQYRAALEKYKGNADIKANQQEIFKLLEDAVGGKVQLQIPNELKNRFKAKEVTNLYRRVCELISIQTRKLLKEAVENNPNFNPMDDIQYIRAMKKFNVYEIKANFLREQGFQIEWGCPTLTFYKLLEGLKRQNLETKLEANQIDKGYLKIIGLVQSNPSYFDQLQIMRAMEDEIAKGRNQFKPQLKIAEQVPKQLVQSKQNSFKVADKDQIEMQELMIRELNSRAKENQEEKQRQVLKVENIQGEKLNEKGMQLTADCRMLSSQQQEIKVSKVPYEYEQLLAVQGVAASPVDDYEIIE